MSQPEGFVVGDYVEKVFLLKRSLYGLKQASKQRCRGFDEFMENLILLGVTLIDVFTLED